MKNVLKNILIAIIIVIILVILNFYKSKKHVFEDITILGLFNDIESQNEYELDCENKVEIDIFTTYNSLRYRKIAPGSKGSFIIIFKKPFNSNYIININEKTPNPHNLFFSIDNKKYRTLEEIEVILNQKFKITDKITINWEWEYYIDEKNDIQDTEDGKIATKYIFEINAIVEEKG